MSRNIFKQKGVREKLESGPFGPYLSDLVVMLQEQRYSHHTIQKYLHAADSFGRWLSLQRIPISKINEELLAVYVASQARRRVRTLSKEVLSHNVVGLKHLLALLRKREIISPQLSITPSTPVEKLLAEYDQYLANTHGAALTTRQRYLYFARQFLFFSFDTNAPEWSTLRAEIITKFVQQETARRQGFGRKGPGSALRIFLRYLIARGVLPAGIEAAVPGMRVWTHASLPEHFSANEISAILTAGATGTAIGKRNYAMLLLLARLGLRAQEVARLRLQDIDWRNGSILLRAGKTHRERLLPLPEDIGQALIDYLKNGRPITTHREIFLQHQAPYNRLETSSAITKMVKRLLHMAGIKHRSSGAHLFRHTAATQMVRQGASFKEVADVLGHQSLQTTGIYAKLDLVALSQVALPWPGGKR